MHGAILAGHYVDRLLRDDFSPGVPLLDLYQPFRRGVQGGELLDFPNIRPANFSGLCEQWMQSESNKRY